MPVAPGSRLGEFDVLGLLGAGGMGEVYRARDTRLDRDVAVKVLPAAIADDADRRTRFMREARAVAALNHPNIVTVHEVGEAAGHPFIAFELVDGETLKARLARSRVAPEEALAIASQIAEGLAHAHEAGVVHRDLKPANVMIRRDGTVKILDFGLGKFLDAAATPDSTTTLGDATRPGGLLGTPGYMAPEQVTGGVIDARADQFAFGVVLYEMLAGAPPFLRETTIQTLNAVLVDSPASLSTIAPNVPPSLAAVVERCLAKRPLDRYGSMRDVLADLRAFAAGTVTRPPMRSLAVRHWPLALGSAVVALAGISVVAWHPWTRPTPVHVTAAPAAAERRVVVLPLTNVGGAANGQAFADGLLEILTTKLTQLEPIHPSLLVVPATEVRRDGVSSARDARRSYGATLVVTGSVQRTNNRVRLTLNVVDPATLRQVSARVIDGRAGDVLALQDSATDALASMLSLPIAPDTRAALVAGGTRMPDAYDYYVQGRGYLQRFERIENVDSAMLLFERALQQDPNFALAHAALGEASWRKYELIKSGELVARARDEVRRAAALDDTSSLIHITAGIVADGTGDPDRAIAELTRAIALDSTNADAYRELGRAYESAERFDAAEATYKKAIDERPADWSVYNALGTFYFTRHRYEEALTAYRRVVELTPDNTRGYNNVGAAQLALGRYEDAASAFERSVAISPTFPALTNLGSVYFALGKYSEAAQAHKRAADLNPLNHLAWGNLGASYDQIPGDGAQARAAYEKAAALADAELRVNPRRATVLAKAAQYAAALGRGDDARAFARRAIVLDPKNPNMLANVASAYETLGDRTSALHVLQQAIDAGYSFEEVNRSKSLAALRQDPRFAAFARRSTNATGNR